MTFEEFTKLPPGEIFASGILPNTPEGLYMTDTCVGDMLRWVAKKGQANDWAIYVHWSRYSIDYVASYGDKVTMRDHILLCVPCDEKMLSYYRY